MSMLQIVTEELDGRPVPLDTAKRGMVLQLAVWEDMANAGELAVDPDELAVIRHYIQYGAN